jgi:exosortase
METMKLTNKRNLYFILFSILVLIAFYVPVMELLRRMLHERLYAYMLIVPFVSGYFIYLKRNHISTHLYYSFKLGTLLLITGILLYVIGEQIEDISQDYFFSLIIFSALTLWIGGFILFYGSTSFRTFSFPLLFLLLMIPIPNIVLEGITHILQWSSAEAAHGLFKLTGVPILRDGFIFHLPGLNIEVAEQCSGINSSIALCVSGIVAGQLFLRTGWKKLVLILSIFPITVLKNGLRIVTLSLLGVYMDERILSSELHRKGGIPFFILAIVFLAPILWGLRRSEKKDQEGSLKERAKGDHQ